MSVHLTGIRSGRLPSLVASLARCSELQALHRRGNAFPVVFWKDTVEYLLATLSELYDGLTDLYDAKNFEIVCLDLNRTTEAQEPG